MPPRLEAVDDAHLRYHLSKPQPDGATELSLSPLELIDRIAALVPPPRVHRHRYHGVLALNSPLRAQVTALAQETAKDTPSTTEANETDDPGALSRSPARYLWATLIALLFEFFPLTSRYCGTEIKIIAFVIETPSLGAIHEHIGEPTRPPAIFPARPCAALSCSAWAPAQTLALCAPWQFQLHCLERADCHLGCPVVQSGVIV